HVMFWFVARNQANERQAIILSTNSDCRVLVNQKMTAIVAIKKTVVLFGNGEQNPSSKR
ncbi:hypothetical protein HJ109_09120, partial [Vibrio parahaemolyticus]|nr:hypothetical protein [Vibrio parahaemolyticus]